MLWNALPKKIKITDSFQTFKKEVKTFHICKSYHLTYDVSLPESYGIPLLLLENSD